MNPWTNGHTPSLVVQTNDHKPPHRWSEEERALVRQGFNGTMRSCALISGMLGRSQRSVHQQASKMGLTKKQAARGQHQWTDEERLVLRRDFPPSNLERERLARRLGVTKWQLNNEAARQGLLRATDYRKRIWTVKEDEYLREWGTRLATNSLATKLHRSKNAVVVHIKRLGISRRERDGWYTKMEACQLLGMDHRWLQRRIDSGVLRATYHHEERPAQGGMRVWHIEEDALRSFVRRYPQELNGRNVDMLGIVELLAGVLGPGKES